MLPYGPAGVLCAFCALFIHYNRGALSHWQSCHMQAEQPDECEAMLALTVDAAVPLAMTAAVDL